MELIRRSFIYPIIQDCQISTSPALGYYLGKSNTAPYGLYFDYPPTAATGKYITYSQGALIIDNSKVAQSGNLIWTFTIWNLQQKLDGEPIKQRLFTLVEDVVRTCPDGYIGQVKCVNRGQSFFDDRRNSFFTRIQFDSYIRINTKAG